MEEQDAGRVAIVISGSGGFSRAVAERLGFDGMDGGGHLPRDRRPAR